MIARITLSLLIAALLATPSHSQDTAPSDVDITMLGCSGVDALGRKVERPCAVTKPDPLRTTGVYSAEERLDTDADRNAARLRELDRLAKPLPRQPDDIRGKPQFGIGVGPYRLDTTEETRKRRDGERIDPYTVEIEDDD